jgi:hypothetical protein
MGSNGCTVTLNLIERRVSETGRRPQVSEIARSMSTRGAPAARDVTDGAAARVPAVERAVRLLDHLAESRRPATLAELSRELSLPREQPASDRTWAPWPR